MKKINEIQDYLGPNRSAYQILLCVAGIIFYAFVAAKYEQFQSVGVAVVLVFTLMMLVKFKPALKHLRFIDQFLRNSVELIPFSEFKKFVNKNLSSGERWLGNCFIWSAEQRQQTELFLNQSWSDYFRKMRNRSLFCSMFFQDVSSSICHPVRFFQNFSVEKQVVSWTPGYPWIHGLSEEQPFYLTSSNLAGHTLILGTTGAGKSRFMEQQILQSIFAGECVIVLDPKGDRAMEENMYQACKSLGKENSFIRIHLAHPEISYGIDLLANYSHVGEIASRITDTFEERDVFVAMGRNVLETLCEGINYLGQKPSFENLQYYYLRRHELAVKALKIFFEKSQTGSKELESLRNLALLKQYSTLRDMYEKSSENPIIERLIALAERDKDHYIKTTTSVFQLLQVLIRTGLRDLLVPASNDGKRLFTDSRKIIQKCSVVYLALDGLSDSYLAACLGRMFLSDLKAVAGARYNFEECPSKVSIFVDEASEFMCEPLLQMLNKSRGANFSLYLATQTIADFVAKSGGSSAQAMRTLANANNIVCFRLNDPETQDFVANRTLVTQILSIEYSHGLTVDSRGFAARSGNLAQRCVSKDARLVPSSLLGALPNLEYFAIVAGGYVMKGRIPIVVPDEQKRGQNE